MASIQSLLCVCVCAAQAAAGRTIAGSAAAGPFARDSGDGQQTPQHLVAHAWHHMMGGWGRIKEQPRQAPAMTHRPTAQLK